GRLPLAAETALFRIAQEALTNIAKHSGAKNVQFFLEQNETEIDLSIQDDGRGFDVEKALQAETATHHLGIHGMRERASLLGGTLFFESKPNEGTRVLVKIPKSNL
ncbi:ATP-binding protein, partial [bacterium]|nr:ATP-binding protein [bacterium]